jgi:hypothetical protein
VLERGSIGGSFRSGGGVGEGGGLRGMERGEGSIQLLIGWEFT